MSYSNVMMVNRIGSHGPVRALATSGLAALVLAALSACAGPQGGTTHMAAAEGRALFEAPAFAGTTPRRAAFADIWQTEEYTLFQGGGAQAEILYITADENDLIGLNYNLLVTQTIEGWRANRRGALSWGDTGVVRAPLGDFRYRTYTRGAERRPCVGFSTDWDRRSDDPMMRATKVLFGYYCGVPGKSSGKQFSKAQVADLLSDIWVRGILRADYRATPTPAATTDPNAVRLARGDDGAATGYADFPLDMAEMFQDAEGDFSG